jgi:nucleotidyltransferase/DNA polymerase involved in DNA repair
MHIDMDCFYAQVERERFPHFRHSPIAVIQNGTLCVTTNYRVRARGLAKMGSPVELFKHCPTIKFAGSDMRRYRAMSRFWLKLFKTYEPLVIVMKKSIDEAYLDLTALVKYRIKHGQYYSVAPHSNPNSLIALANQRFAVAKAAWQAEDMALLAKLGHIDENLLESSGSMAAAIRASKSTDPMTELSKCSHTLLLC